MPIATTEAHGSPETTLLIVDDDPALLRSLGRRLSQRNYRAVCVESAARGMAALRERRFDAIVSDLTLPMDGGEVFAAATRRLCPQTPIIVITGYDSLDAVRNYLRSVQVDAILPKPFTIAELERTIALVVARVARSSSHPDVEAR